VLVPYAVFNVSMSVVLLADEEMVSCAEPSVKQVREEFTVPPTTNYIVCAALDETDRKFYNEMWSDFDWKLDKVWLFDPVKDRGLIVPQERIKEYELLEMKKRICKKRKDNEKGFLETMLTVVSEALTTTKVFDEHKAPPTDAYFIPSSNPDSLWLPLSMKLEKQIRNQAHLRYSILEKRENVRMKNERVELLYSSYTAYLVYLPVFSGFYEFAGEGQPVSYRVAVNGQSGDVKGQKPSAGLFGALFG